MEAVEKLLTAVAGTLGQKSEELITSLKNENGEFVEDFDAKVVQQWTARVEQLRNEDKSKFDEKLENLVKKERLKTASEFENELKALIPDADGVQGAKAIREAIEARIKSKADGNTDWKKSDEFLQLQRQWDEAKQREIEAAQQPWEQKYNELQTSIERQKIYSSLNSVAREFWNGRKVAITDPTIQENQFKLFVDRVANSANMKVVDGKLMIVDENGEAKKDTMGNLIPLSSLLEGNFVGYVPENVQGQRQGANLGGGGEYKGALPTTSEDALRMIADRSISSADRMKIADYAEKQGLI